MRVWLKDARQKLDMSTTAVGYHVGVSQAAIVQWERGARAPSRTHQLKLAQVLSAPHLPGLFDAELTASAHAQGVA